jgi:hypothetical protein
MGHSATTARFSRWETEPLLAIVTRTFNQLLNGVEHGLNLQAVLALPPLQIVQPAGDLLMRRQQLPQADKGAHDGILTSMARLLVSTEDNIAIPCSVNA